MSPVAVIRPAVIVGIAAALTGSGLAQDERCPPLQLDVWRIEARPTQYADFCALERDACDLSGAPVVDWEATRSRLERVNGEVNAEVTFVPDRIGEGPEECWEFPTDGTGDCEDFALEKRRRLVAEGVPSAALTMAIVHHEVRFFPHAVLLVETTRGTRVLDNLFDELVCWDAVPYRYERRERPDGTWERYAIR